MFKMAKPTFTALLTCLLLAAVPAMAGEAKEDMTPATKAAKDVVAGVAKDVDTAAQASEEPTNPADNQTGGVQLPVPRFVTLGPDEVNVRTGPGTRYPIKFVIRKGGLPVEITREFQVWREIRDMDGDKGWVHKAMLSGRRAIIVRGQVRTILKKPDDAAQPVVRLEPGVIADLEGCREKWCSVKIATYDGWLKKTDIWGVYDAETIKE
jgi:SH3-like domain-containing protein